jgi:hypothetical protein
MRAEGPQISQTFAEPRFHVAPPGNHGHRVLDEECAAAQSDRGGGKQLPMTNFQLPIPNTQFPLMPASHKGSTGAFVRTVRGGAECKCSRGKGLTGQERGYENADKGRTVRTVRAEWKSGGGRGVAVQKSGCENTEKCGTVRAAGGRSWRLRGLSRRPRLRQELRNQIDQLAIQRGQKPSELVVDLTEDPEKNHDTLAEVIAKAIDQIEESKYENYMVKLRQKGSN